MSSKDSPGSVFAITTSEFLIRKQVNFLHMTGLARPGDQKEIVKLFLATKQYFSNSFAMKTANVYFWQISRNAII